MLCQDVAPAFAIFRVPGLMQDRAEQSYVQTRLFPKLRDEAKAHGMVLLTPGRSAPTSCFRACRSIRCDTLRSLNLWQSGPRSHLGGFTRAMGMHRCRCRSPTRARRTKDGKTDGFVAIPSAIFGFQWFSKQVYLPSCRSRRCTAARS